MTNFQPRTAERVGGCRLTVGRHGLGRAGFDLSLLHLQMGHRASGSMRRMLARLVLLFATGLLMEAGLRAQQTSEPSETEMRRQFLRAFEQRRTPPPDASPKARPTATPIKATTPAQEPPTKPENNRGVSVKPHEKPVSKSANTPRPKVTSEVDSASSGGSKAIAGQKADQPKDLKSKRSLESAPQKPTAQVTASKTTPRPEAPSGHSTAKERANTEGPRVLTTVEQEGTPSRATLLMPNSKATPGKLSTSTKPPSSPAPKSTLRLAAEGTPAPRPEGGPEIDFGRLANPQRAPVVEAAVAPETKEKSKSEVASPLDTKNSRENKTASQGKGKSITTADSGPLPPPEPRVVTPSKATQKPLSPSGAAAVAAAQHPEKPKGTAPTSRNPKCPRILMVGDSLSVNDFGESMERYLKKRFEPQNVAFYASCGSSPEHWLRKGPLYVTKCGYREFTAKNGDIVHDFYRGRPPEPTSTPRLEDLLPDFRPTTVIVQLGTNWMDAIKARKVKNDERYRTILKDFVAALRCQPGSDPQIIWITPPDASRFSPEVKRTVQSLIEVASKSNGFKTIDSRKMMTYVLGKSGGDGVHFNSKTAKLWADEVTKTLDDMIVMQ